MSNRANYYDIEQLCQNYFNKLGTIFHLCTPENHAIVFRSSDDFMKGMTLIGLAAKASKGIRILTFELMSNHIHIIIVGSPIDIEAFFTCYKKLLEKCLYTNENGPDLKRFTMNLHKIESLENLRNAIAYVNRNGSMVDRNVCPYTYPWGANKYFFNTEAKARYRVGSSPITLRDRRQISKSHKYDDVTDLYLVDGYACPLSFCHIEEAEMVFRDTRHYFTKVSRHIESYDEIAKMLGEQLYYTDDDLYSILSTRSARTYDGRKPTLLQKDEKIEMAKWLRGKYNADIKQIGRLLKIDMAILKALFSSSE